MDISHCNNQTLIKQWKEETD